MDTTYKKNLGYWGEKQLDIWMEKNNWYPMEKNLKILGGEIDRVYFQQVKNNEKSICISEIKTNVIYSYKLLYQIFTEVGIKKYIKNKQIHNLYKLSENYLHKKYSKIYIRIFIIIIFNKNLSVKKFNKNLCPFKVCYLGENYIIFSFEPEFTIFNARKSLLQIKI